MLSSKSSLFVVVMVIIIIIIFTPLGSGGGNYSYYSERERETPAQAKRGPLCPLRAVRWPAATKRERESKRDESKRENIGGMTGFRGPDTTNAIWRLSS